MVKETGASVCTVVVHPSPHELEPCASKGVGSEPIQSWKNSHTLASDRLKNSLRVFIYKGNKRIEEGMNIMECLERKKRPSD